MTELKILLAEDLVIVPVILAIITIAQELSRGHRQIMVEALIASLFALILEITLRQLYPTTRPYLMDHISALITHPPVTNSFPSGHTITAFTAAFITLSRNRWWGGAAVVAAVLVGIGRVAVHVHRPVDIFGGILVAAVSVLLAKWAIRRLFSNKKIPAV